MPVIDINIEDLSFKMEVFDNETLSNQLVERGYHTQNDVALLREFLKEGSTFLDLGANIGWYSLIASQLVGPTGRVHAYEPDANNTTLLQRNQTLNGISNIVIDQCAISDRDGVVNFYNNPENFGDHSVATSTYQRCFNIDEKFAGAGQVSCRTIDSVIDIEQFKNVGLVKIDIQGCECRALAGMKQSLLYHRPPILIEYSPAHIYAAQSSPFELFVFIENNNYFPMRVVPNGRDPVQLQPISIIELFEETVKNHNTFAGVDLLLIPR